MGQTNFQQQRKKYKVILKNCQQNDQIFFKKSPAPIYGRKSENKIFRNMKTQIADIPLIHSWRVRQPMFPVKH
jgi:hypothetical protein